MTVLVNLERGRLARANAVSGRDAQIAAALSDLAATYGAP